MLPVPRIFMKAKLFLLVLLCTAVAHAQTYNESILYNFGSSSTDGVNPWGGLVMDKAGNLYGTTVSGGDANCVGVLAGGCGTVFKLDPAGNETILHSFAGGSDGQNPVVPLIMDKFGNLYGATVYGGLRNNQGGTIFRISRAGKYSVVHRFSGAPNDGQNPWGSLTMDGAGNLYGTTFLGGSSLATPCQPARGPRGCGTVFKITPAGQETILYNFNGGTDGGLPMGNVQPDSQSNLYGTASGFGANNYGVLFKLTPAGAESVLYNFCPVINCADGAIPGFITRDSLGNIFGYADPTGSAANFGFPGVAFEYSIGGTESALYTFCSGFNCSNPSKPSGQLLALAGNFYGTSYQGGAADQGTVYELNPTGGVTILYSFNFNARLDGYDPLSGVISDAAGNLYGTTYSGGSTGGGTVFKLTKN